MQYNKCTIKIVTKCYLEKQEKLGKKQKQKYERQEQRVLNTNLQADE